MELISARTGDGVGQESGGAPVLGREIIGGHAILLDRLGGDRSERTGDQVIVILQAVEHEVRGGGPLAIDRQAEPARRAGVGGDAGLRHQHRVDVAARQRQIANLRRIDHLRDRGFERAPAALRRLERTGPAGVHIGTVEGHDRLAAGQEHAAVLSRFPDII